MSHDISPDQTLYNETPYQGAEKNTVIIFRTGLVSERIINLTSEQRH